MKILAEEKRATSLQNESATEAIETEAEIPLSVMVIESGCASRRCIPQNGAMGQFTIVVPTGCSLPYRECIRRNTGHRQSWIPCGHSFRESEKIPQLGKIRQRRTREKKRMSALSLPAPKYHPFVARTWKK